MNFLEAVKIAVAANKMLRRKGWADGIAMYIKLPDEQNKYDGFSNGAPYVATCHVAACALGGVRTVADILADDWEFMYPEDKV